MKKQTSPINRNILLTGFTSFFTDISSEMIYPLLQAFIRSVLKAQASLLGPLLGIIEGTAESTASLLKVFSGYYSDRIQRRKPPTIAGYSLSLLSKLLYLMPLWFTVLLARFFDRIGKGIRTAPRDALVSESALPGASGRAFGFQRAMDFAGACIGTASAYFIIKYIFPGAASMEEPGAFYPIFLLALIPAFLGIVFLFFIKEKIISQRNAPIGERRSELKGEPFNNPAEGSPSVSANKKQQRPGLNIKSYDKSLKLFFLSQLIFTLGNSSNQFLLLRSVSLGYALTAVLLMYTAFNFSTAVLSTLFGSISDRTGRRAMLAAGYVLYCAVYMGFGIVTPGTRSVLWVLWPLYGLYYAMTEGVEKAFVSDLAPLESKATALGFYNTIVGIGLFPASLIAGALFRLAEFAPFIFGGGMAASSIAILLLFVRAEKSERFN